MNHPAMPPNCTAWIDEELRLQSENTSGDWILIEQAKQNAEAWRLWGLNA